MSSLPPTSEERGVDDAPSDVLSLCALPLSLVTERSRRESARYYQGNPADEGYGYELFRRAVMAHSEDAWAAIYEVYQPLVAAWVRRHRLLALADEELVYFVNRSFEKIWTTLTPDRFSGFPRLKSLLCYWRLCVHSVIVDHVRAAGHETAARTLALDSDEKDALIMTLPSPSTELEAEIIDAVHRDMVWRQIDGRLTSHQERLVLYGSFAFALKPRELQTLFQDELPTINDVYRIKSNVLARLRRDDGLHSMLQ